MCVKSFIKLFLIGIYGSLIIAVAMIKCDVKSFILLFLIGIYGSLIIAVALIKCA